MKRGILLNWVMKRLLVGTMSRSTRILEESSADDFVLRDLGNSRDHEFEVRVRESELVSSFSRDGSLP